MKSLNVGSSIGSFACDKEFRVIAVGGREVLKLVEFTGDAFKNFKNLRSKAYTKYNTNYIDWNPKINYHFATASVLGSLNIWDIQS